jgi:heme/copper-type cytochrome/quinol oxidase subunit 2
MRQTAHVVTQQDFDAWLAKQKPAPTGSGATASASPTIPAPTG